MSRRSVTQFLKAFNSYSQKFFEMEPDLQIVLDAQGNIIKVNPAFERLLGYAEHEVKGIHIGALVHGDDTAKFIRSFSLISGLYSFRLLRHSGGEVEVSMIASQFVRVLDEAGRECFLILRPTKGH